VVSRDALKVPLLARRLERTGDLLLRAEVVLFAIDAGQSWRLLTFRVDSATEVTSMPAALARELNLPLPQHPVPGLVVVGTTGEVVREVRNGFLRVRLLGLEEREFVFPCYLLGAPDAPEGERTAKLPRNLLGLTGVVNHVRILLDGEAEKDALHGVMTLEMKRLRA